MPTEGPQGISTMNYGALMDALKAAEELKAAAGMAPTPLAAQDPTPSETIGTAVEGASNQNLSSHVAAVGEKPSGPIGTVKLVSGDVTITRNGEVIQVEEGMVIMEGDQVSTGDNGFISMHFGGSSQFSLYENNEMTLEMFSYGLDESPMNTGILKPADPDLLAEPLVHKVLNPTTVLGVAG